MLEAEIPKLITSAAKLFANPRITSVKYKKK